jgi:hypothetical protein
MLLSVCAVITVLSEMLTGFAPVKRTRFGNC